VAALLAAGAPVGLGVDGAASNECGELVDELRAALVVARASGGPTALTARQALELATRRGARCLGREDELGHLSVGALADVALWDLDEAGFAGIADPVAALAFGPTRHVDALLVGGELVVGRSGDAGPRAGARERADAGGGVKGSRGVRRNSFTLVTPANHYPSRLPPFGDVPVVKLVTPRFAPARFGEYLVALPAGGGTVEPVAAGFEMFLYGLEGDATARAEGVTGTSGGGGELSLRAGAFAYLPAPVSFTLVAGEAPARLLIVKRRYEPWPGLDAPTLLAGHRDDEPFADTPVPGFRRRELLPVADPAFDFNMSLLAFDAGVGLDNIEVHDEEHGLYMTAGAGRYFLGGERHDVRQGDFIYMAPYCPQSFTAGPDGGEYLLYKDAWRDGFGFVQAADPATR
jgi:(S)-ureidoglycine aminohydrolase